MSPERNHTKHTESCCGAEEQTDCGYHANIFVKPDDLPASAARIYQAGYFIEDVSCLDMQEGFQVIYHFDRFDRHHRVCLRVMISRDMPELPSISSIFPGADWHERECFDFFGVSFKGHPNLIPLLLDPDHDGPPPLIKDEKDRQDINQLFPGCTGRPIKPDSEEFTKSIIISNTANRNHQ